MKCARCKKDRPIEDFPLKENSPTIRGRRCAPCKNSKSARWVKNNPDKARHAVKKNIASGKKREYRLKQYGISSAIYDKMLDDQGGGCAICRRTFPRLVVDHCHRDGHVRGLLCHGCNRAIGYMRDDTVALAAAIIYLKSK